LTDRDLLTHAGSISHDTAKAKAEVEFERFRCVQAALPQPVDEHFQESLNELEQIEGQAKALPDNSADKPKKKQRGD